MASDRYRVRLLGGFAVEEPPTTPPPGGRATAILAVLALAGPLGCTRERLMALLWPDDDETHARHKLRDVLYTLRQILGSGILTGPGESLRLDPAVVLSDVGTFRDALRAGHLEDAVGAYGGPLLDGFHIRDAPEFERWLDDERGALSRDHQQALKRLAKRAEADGRWDAAAEWWTRGVSADPYNSRMVVRLMLALARAGDRANAIRVAEAHCALLWTEMDLEPDPGFLEELERIRDGHVPPVSFFTPRASPYHPEP